MNATLHDDKEKLENIRNSAKKFFHHYILLVSISSTTQKKARIYVELEQGWRMLVV